MIFAEADYILCAKHVKNGLGTVKYTVRGYRGTVYQVLRVETYVYFSRYLHPLTSFYGNKRALGGDGRKIGSLLGTAIDCGDVSSARMFIRVRSSY